MDNKVLQLVIVTPDTETVRVECDSVHLEVSDGEKNGGMYGIRPGHAKSIISLKGGKLTAFLSGKVVFESTHSDGFANVSPDTVTVVVEKNEV